MMLEIRTCGIPIPTVNRKLQSQIATSQIDESAFGCIMVWYGWIGESIGWRSGSGSGL